MRPADERRRYNVTSSLIGWAHAQIDPWSIIKGDHEAGVNATISCKNIFIKSVSSQLYNELRSFMPPESVYHYALEYHVIRFLNKNFELNHMFYY